MAPLLALAFASTLQLCGTSPSHDIEANLRGSKSLPCSPRECCHNGRYTTNASGGKEKPQCHTTTAHPALVAIANTTTHYRANPTWQRLHISIPSNISCTSYLEGAKLSFEFDGRCGTGKCYHYWKISKFMHAEGKNITEEGLKKNCGFKIGNCPHDKSGKEFGNVSGWHATVSKLLEIASKKAEQDEKKQEWLNSKKWTLQTWTIEDLSVPYAKCAPPRPTPAI